MSAHLRMVGTGRAKKRADIFPETAGKGVTRRVCAPVTMGKPIKDGQPPAAIEASPPRGIWWSCSWLRELASLRDIVVTGVPFKTLVVLAGITTSLAKDHSDRTVSEDSTDLADLGACRAAYVWPKPPGEH
jgi:hypothetical protein